MKTKGLAAFNRRIDRMPQALRTELRTELNAGADRVVALAKSLAPVDEGDLRNSIRKDAGRHELAVTIKAGGAMTQRPVRSGVTAPTYDYAAKLEAEQPFFYPSYRALRKSIQSRLAKAMRASIRRGQA